MSKNILNTIAYCIPVYMTTKANYNMVENCIYSFIKYNKSKYIFIINFDSHKYFINLLRRKFKKEIYVSNNSISNIKVDLSYYLSIKDKLKYIISLFTKYTHRPSSYINAISNLKAIEIIKKKNYKLTFL